MNNNSTLEIINVEIDGIYYDVELVIISKRHDKKKVDIDSAIIAKSAIELYED